ncbi:hypothetical protein MZO42_04345 [Sphingomonas psychrotolerans]|uniref:Transcriptional regulator n=1 Tax=Sphingomonas psychrotolerans TaxID=1327635 RepID=A0ABU3N038_9SPHN|nr:hypothetical protein [Sphingomonas psychrotolerans]MDT8757918.1 hypothetical protein [Sphingomonas psychrotolerans]
MTDSSPRTLAPFAGLRLAPHPDWPPESQYDFLHTLLRTGDVPTAAASVGANASAVTRFRSILGRRSTFARAWRRAVEEARIDALAARVLRRGGLDAPQLARVDAACHGTTKARLALALAWHARHPATDSRHD